MDRPAINPFFVKQMAMYSAYHRDARNRATHFIGIPAIVFAIFIPLHWVPVADLWAGERVITAATLLWLVNGGLYLRPEVRRVGEECVVSCSFRWWQYH